MKIYKKDLLPLMVELVHDQYGLQEQEYEQYLDNLQNNNFIDVSSEHTLHLFKDFIDIFPDLQEIVNDINYNGTNPKVTNIVIDGTVDSKEEA